MRSGRAAAVIMAKFPCLSLSSARIRFFIPAPLNIMSTRWIVVWNHHYLQAM
jgi:hypothetical protein